MPVIVKSPHHQIVLLDEALLLRPHRIVLFLESLRLVQVTIERGLVRDDEILARGGRANQHVISRHHRGCDARHARVRIARLESVHCLAMPGHADVRLDAFDHLAGCQSAALLAK